MCRTADAVYPDGVCLTPGRLLAVRPASATLDPPRRSGWPSRQPSATSTLRQLQSLNCLINTVEVSSEGVQGRGPLVGEGGGWSVGLPIFNLKEKFCCR